MTLKINVLLTMLFILASSIEGLAQTRIKGKVMGATDQNPLPEVKITVEHNTISTLTDSEGKFVLEEGTIPNPDQILIMTKTGYKQKRFPVTVHSGRLLDMGKIEMEVDMESTALNIAQIDLTEDELSLDRNSASNISGLLSSSKDAFFKAAAYDFSAAFFNPRGLDNRNGQYLINGIEMNKLQTGRPEFGDFGGLNDEQRNKVFYAGIKANPYQFGAMAGTTNTTMRASQYGQGGKISYAAANRSYRGRVMASYNSGLTEKGWAYSFLVSRRFGKHGYKDGTAYNANSLFISTEKKFSDAHSLNFTGFYSPNRRGKSAPITEEVKSLRGMHYNSYWGRQNGHIRNSRTKEVKEPVVMLNHFWDISSQTSLNTNVAYQFGKRGSTRLDNGGTRLVYGPDGQKSYIGGARNPGPDYYQKLPSYHLRDDDLNAADYQAAYLAEHDFMADGQLDWGKLYEANAIARQNGGHSTYILQNDRMADKRFYANSILESDINEHLTLNAALHYQHLQSENYAQIDDLLGGDGYLDIDFYADEPREINSLVTDLAQSDMNQPDRVAKEGDRYKYNYTLNSDYASAFAQGQFKFKRLDFFLGAKVTYTTIQRDGKFKNGYYPENSYGKSNPLSFTDYGVKGGLTYKFSGKHMLRGHAGYFTKAPTLNKVFNNARQSNYPVIGLKSVKARTADLSYIFRSASVKGRVTGFYSGIKDATEIGYFFTQGLSGMGVEDDAAFVQEITTGINKRNLGLEFGIEAEVTPTITLKTAGSIGQSVYTNNPNLYLTSEDFQTKQFHGSQLAFAEKHGGAPLQFGDGKTRLKNYHLSGGPEQAFQIGMEYSDPNYWFIGTTANFFSDAYVDVSKLRRTTNFTTDADGLPIRDYSEGTARQLLRQDKLGAYWLFNMVGGKSWKVGDYFIGFFGIVNNLFNQDYRTLGFESGRKSNYTKFNKDQSRPNGPLFGNKYFYGYGTTFYLNVYVRF